MKYYRMLILFCVITLLSGCSLNTFVAHKSVPASYVNRVCEPGSRSIWLVNFGWHTGILLRTQDIHGPLKNLIPELQHSRYAEFGWGDRDFYTSSNYSWLMGFKALFFSSGSVMQVAEFENIHPFLSDKQIVEMKVNQTGYNHLIDHLTATLQLNDAGHAIPLGKSLYDQGHFYSAKGNFSLNRTCNVWCCDKLKAAGCKVEATRYSSTLLRELHALPQS